MDDASLVEAARSGDGAAWGAIYDRYADKLHDHCHRILRDRDEAADALHDAFIAAARNLEQRRDPARLRPWPRGPRRGAAGFLGHSVAKTATG